MPEQHSAENDAGLTALTQVVYDAPMPPDTPGVSVTEAKAVAAAVLAAGYAPTASLTTHNGTPVTPENLRYAATHEALCRSWIFDVLTGLADALDTCVTPPGSPEATP